MKSIFKIARNVWKRKKNLFFFMSAIQELTKIKSHHGAFNFALTTNVLNFLDITKCHTQNISQHVFIFYFINN